MEPIPGVMPLAAEARQRHSNNKAAKLAARQQQQTAPTTATTRPTDLTGQGAVQNLW